MSGGGIGLDEKSLEIARLRRGLSDVVGLLGLSATWAHGTSGGIARSLGEALFAVLDLDFVVTELAGEVAVVQIRQGFAVADPEKLRAQLRRSLGEEPGAWPASSRHAFEGAEVSLATVRLGLERAFGTIVAGTARPDFPGETERLLLSIAGNQILVALQDAQLQREQRLLASEQSASALIEGIPGLVAVLAPDGQVQRVNRQIEDYCGRPLDELRHWGTNGIVHPEDMPHVAEIFGASIATGSPYYIEQRLRRFDGVYRWFENRGRPLVGEGGAILAWHVLLTDVDDRKRAEEAVRASELNLRQQSETFPQMLWSATPAGNIDYCNERLLDYSGLTAAEVKDGGWVNLLHPDDREPTAAVWMRCIATGDPYSVEVRHFRLADQTYRWNLTMALPLRDGEGSIVKWYGSCVDIHDRKLAEEGLKASERHLQLTIDTIPALAWSAHEDGTADFFSQQYLDYVGQSRERLCGWQWTGLVHPDDLAGLAATWESCRVAGRGAEVEARLQGHDGVYRWFLFKTSPLRDECGAIVKWYGVNTDIEDMKRAEQALSARERTLREAHDHLSQAQRLSQTGSFTTDVHADTHTWSEELYRILEYERKEVPAFRAFRDRVHPEDIAAFDAGFKRAMAGRSDFDEVFRIVTPRGNTKHLHAVAHFMPGSADRPIVIGSIQDITNSKHAEDELRRRETLLATAERISETGSFSWDLSNNKLVWSPQMYRIHELDEGLEPVYPNLLATVHPDDLQKIDERTKRAFQGEGSPDDSYRLLMHDGRTKYLRTAYQVIRHEDGRLESFGVAQDVTRRRLAEDSLDRLRSELAHVTRTMSLGQLAASITHEVNQPLSGIITNASTCLRMLAADPPDIEGAIKTAQRTIRDGNRASEVTRRLRGLFRKQDFVPEPFDLNDAAQEVIAICAHDLQRRRIAMSVQLDSALPPVRGDRVQLQQVILNLVLNAADAMDGVEDRPRQIVVETAKAAPGLAQMTVRDTGRGVATEDLGKIFEAFYTTKADGMGIGLSVSRSIIERHEGKLSASANEGPGTNFFFSVPCAATGRGAH